MATRSSLLKPLIENRGAILLSLVLAVILWHAVQQIISFEDVVNDVPLKFKVDEGWAVTDRSADTVDVHFRGSQEDLARLDRAYVNVELDVRGVEGSTVLRITPDDVESPSGVRAFYVWPETVELTLDRKTEKQVPVRVETRGVPPEGYGIQGVASVPATVRVGGPRDRLAGVEYIATAPVDLEGKTRSLRERVALVEPSENWVASVDPRNVVAEVTIVEQSASKTFTGVPVRALVESGNGTSVDVTPSKVQLVLQGQRQLLEKVEADSVKVYVDCTGLDQAARYELPVQVSLPSGIRAQEIVPAAVEVMLRVE